VPQTLIGLVVFAAVVAPGLVYTVVREAKHPSSRESSQFRDTVAVVGAGLAAQLAALWLFALVRWWKPEDTPNIGELLTKPPKGEPPYLIEHLPYVAGWGLAILALACAIGGLLAFLPSLPVGTISRASGWHKAFRAHGTKRIVYVACELTDGTYLRGKLWSHSTATDETGDRDLILIEAELRRRKSEDFVALGTGLTIVTAREIRFINVTYGKSA
jgi:hypothetical protein